MAGGQSGGVASYLPIAAALAATVATDGAAAPWLGEALGAEAGTAGATVLGAGAMGALTGGATSAINGGNILQGAAIGGLGGAAMGGIGAAYGGGAGATPEGITPSVAQPVSGSVAVPSTPFDPMQASQEGFMYTGPNVSPEIGTQGAMAASSATGGVPVNSAGLPIESMPNPTNVPPGSTPPGSNGIMKFLADNKGIAALGGTALLGTLMQKSNNQYGTPSNQAYSGPLTDFHYSRGKYTPLVATPPNPAYQAQYANYRTNPYMAEGGVIKMADGGLAQGQMANPSVGPVEQMSRDNAMGNNQMFPQANINSPAFSSATNTPMGSNMIAPTSDANVDPYTGAERFAEGGTTEAPAAIPLQAMPNAITQNSVANNNALTQDLVSRLVARNAANPVPNQTPPVSMQPAGIMAAAPTAYTPPAFTRPTNVAPIEFQNPKAIVGTKAFNDEQARLAAEAAAQQAALNTRQVNQGDGQFYAAGGSVGHLGGYSDGGRMLKGPGDGMSDNIPATIAGKQPARLADSEFVIPADVVSHLGNGSSDAGAKKLYQMMDNVRKARTGTKKQGKQINANKFLPK
jgi:hypothetical protein